MKPKTKIILKGGFNGSRHVQATMLIIQLRSL